MLSNSFVKCFATYNATKRKHFKNRLPESHDSFSLSSHEAVGLVECLHRCKTPKWTAANLAYFRQKNYKTITIQHQWNTENCDGDACHQTKNPTCHQHLWNYDHIQLWLRLWLSSTSSVWTDNISRTATRNDTTRNVLCSHKLLATCCVVEGTATKLNGNIAKNIYSWRVCAVRQDVEQIHGRDKVESRKRQTLRLQILSQGFLADGQLFLNFFQTLVEFRSICGLYHVLRQLNFRNKFLYKKSPAWRI